MIKNYWIVSLWLFGSSDPENNKSKEQEIILKQGETSVHIANSN